MELVLILLIWLVAPLVELGIIIALIVKNDRQKAKTAAQLTEWLEQQKHGEEPDDAQLCPEVS